MPVLIVIALYIVRIWRLPIDRRLKQHRTGPVVIGRGLLAVLTPWLQYRPPGISLPYLAGVEVVLSGVRMPRVNSITERWVQTCRYELLDRTLNWNY